MKEKKTTTTIEQRYYLIRLALFDPAYLIHNRTWTEEDFTRMVDEIVRLKRIEVSAKRTDDLLFGPICKHCGVPEKQCDCLPVEEPGACS